MAQCPETTLFINVPIGAFVSMTATRVFRKSVPLAATSAYLVRCPSRSAYR
ncbi:hypothetical protein GCM10023205_52860 [Yinghuangia aomiensis]|uniref:Uncharacterized protein n=1 Tax=Yinghuangia aomiensis TaxID=676205 RepID=A0ABP9HTP7_9ACTN